MSPAHHDVAGPVGAVGAIGLAAVPWVVNLEMVLRIGSYALSIAVAGFTLYHFYNIYIRKKAP